MTEPECPQKRPYPVQVESGKEYHVCMCGRSQNQPMCDGSHAGSGLGPRIFTATEDGFLFTMREHPLVYPGALLGRIAKNIMA